MLPPLLLRLHGNQGRASRSCDFGIDLEIPGWKSLQACERTQSESTQVQKGSNKLDRADSVD